MNGRNEHPIVQEKERNLYSKHDQAHQKKAYA